MSISNGMLAEFEHEMAQTRKALERVSGDHLDWAPHAKSMNYGDLATHLASIPGWTKPTLTLDSLDVSTVEMPARIGSAADALKMFDEGVAEAKATIAACTDETWMSPWSLVMGGETQFTMPKIAVFRSFIMNHMIHHRAQLGVYFRMNETSVPSTYGPSADEVS